MTTELADSPKIRAAMGNYVQYGCGLSAPEGWLNFDASPTLRMQKVWLVGRYMPGPRFPSSVRYGDIIKGLPVPDASAVAAYCSHTLEHLSFEDCKTALRNTFRVLKPGGVFRMVLPDLRVVAVNYVADHSPDAALHFMQGTLLGQARRARGAGGLMRAWIGNSDHRWMWDFESMQKALSDAGFTDIRRVQYGDSGDPIFDLVEDPDRWNGCLGVQCIRPDG